MESFPPERSGEVERFLRAIANGERIPALEKDLHKRLSKANLVTGFRALYKPVFRAALLAYPTQPLTSYAKTNGVTHVVRLVQEHPWATVAIALGFVGLGGVVTYVSK